MNALPKPLAAPIVAALNHLIEQEPWACSLLTPFAGRVIRYDAAAFALSLKVTEQGGIEQASEAETPSVTIIVPLQQWPLVVADVAEGGQAAAMRHVRIDGDAELANAVSTLGRNLRDAGYPRLGNGVTVFPGATIIGSVTLEQGVTVGAGTVVSRSLAAGVVVAGNPARIVRYPRADDGAGQT